MRGPCLNDGWIREVAFKDGTTLLDVHEAIQKMIGFDDDHLIDFYFAKNIRSKKESIMEQTIREDSNDLSEYKNFLLSEIDFSYKKFYYHFDFGDDWLFQISLSRNKSEFNFKGQYHIFKSVGENPEQYPD